MSLKSLFLVLETHNEDAVHVNSKVPAAPLECPCVWYRAILIMSFESLLF